MATTPAKKKALAQMTKLAPVTRRKISAASAADIVEGAEDVRVSLTPASAVEQEERVTAVVPKPFIITRDDGSVHHYPAGTQEMPVSDATHWFAKASGVQVYAPE